MFIKICILLFFFNPIQSKKTRKSDELDIATFRDPDKFSSFLKSHDNNLTSAINAMDSLIFQEDGEVETINELRDIQKRLERSENFISKIENAPNPTMAAFYDIIRLLLDISPMIIDFINHMTDLIPIDANSQNSMIGLMGFMEKSVQFGEGFFDRADFEKRKKAFEEQDSVIRIKNKRTETKKMGRAKKLDDDDKVKGIIEEEFDKKILD